MVSAGVWKYWHVDPTGAIHIKGGDDMAYRITPHIARSRPA
jgi:hypothetical protein